MKTLKKVPVIVEFVEGELPFENMAENKFYISKEKMHMTHNCLCGCGTFINLPIHRLNIENKDSLESKENTGWWCVEVKDGKLTVTPSILNHPCEGHYIIDIIFNKIIYDSFSAIFLNYGVRRL